MPTRRTFLTTTLRIGAVGALGTVAATVIPPAPVLAEQLADPLGELAAIRRRLVDDWVSRDHIDDGTTARVEWTYQSQATTYLSTQQADGSWSDVDYASTTSAANGAPWPPYRALDRMQAMAAAYANPGGAHHRSAALLAGVQKAVDHWFLVSPTNTNWWERDIGIQLRLQRVAVLLFDRLGGARNASIIATLPTRASGLGQNAVWYSQNVVFRGLITPDPALVVAGRNAVSAAIAVQDSPGDGTQGDLSYHQHGMQLHSSGYGRTMLTDVAHLMYMFRGTSFAFVPTAVQDHANFILDGTRWMLNGDHAEFNIMLNPRPRYISNASRVLDALGWMGTVLPSQAAEFTRTARDIRLQGGDNGLVGHKYFWRSDFSAHQRRTWGVTVKMVSARTVGSEVRTSNAANVNYLYWVPFGTTFIARRGDEYRDLPPVWDWSQLPGATNPAVLVSNTVGNAFRQSTTFVGGVDNGLYGAAALDQDKNGTKARKGYFCFDDEFVALGAGISSTASGTVITTLNQCRRNGDVTVAGTRVEPGTTAGFSGTWAHHDGIAYVFPQQVTMQVKNVTVTGSWANIAAAEDPTPITQNLFGIWLDHGVKPTTGSYAYVVRPDVTVSRARTYAADLPVRIIANTTSVQAVRHDRLGVAQLLFYAAGTASIRDGLSVTVDQPCLLIVDESGCGSGDGIPVLTVANPQTPNLAVTITLTTGTTSSTRTVTLPGGANLGRSLTIGSSPTSLAHRKPVTVSSTAGSEAGAHFLTDGNPKTRWESANSDVQWAQVDLQTVQVVRQVTLTWDAAHARAFTVELSTDGLTWRQVHSTTTGSGGTQTFTFTSQAARFVRVSMRRRGTRHGYSLRAIDVEGSPDLALGRPVTASSAKAADVAAANITDGNTATRWGSNYADPQWIRVDLGATASIGAVLLRWEASSAKAFTIDVSTDDQNWTTAYSTADGAGGVQLIPVTANARYVRVRGTVRNDTRYGYSLWSLEVYA